MKGLTFGVRTYSFFRHGTVLIVNIALSAELGCASMSSPLKDLSNVLYLCRKGTLSSLCKQLDVLSTMDGATVRCVAYIHASDQRCLAVYTFYRILFSNP